MDDTTNVLNEILLELKNISSKLDMVIGQEETEGNNSLRDIYGAVDYMHDNMIKLAGKIVDAIYETQP